MEKYNLFLNGKNKFQSDENILDIINTQELESCFAEFVNLFKSNKIDSLDIDNLTNIDLENMLKHIINRKKASLSDYDKKSYNFNINLALNESILLAIDIFNDGLKLLKIRDESLSQKFKELNYSYAGIMISKLENEAIQNKTDYINIMKEKSIERGLSFSNFLFYNEQLFGKGFISGSDRAKNIEELIEKDLDTVVLDLITLTNDKTNRVYKGLEKIIRNLISIKTLFSDDISSELDKAYDSWLERNPFLYYNLIKKLENIPKLENIISIKTISLLKYFLLIEMIFISARIKESERLNYEYSYDNNLDDEIKDLNKISLSQLQSLLFIKNNLIIHFEPLLNFLKNQENLDIIIIKTKFNIEKIIIKDKFITLFKSTDIFEYINNLYKTDRKYSRILINIILKNIKFFLDNDDIDLVKKIQLKIKTKQDFLDFSSFFGNNFPHSFTIEHLNFLLDYDLINHYISKKQSYIDLFYLAYQEGILEKDDIKSISIENVDKLLKIYPNYKDSVKFIGLLSKSNNIENLIKSTNLVNKFKLEFSYITPKTLGYNECLNFINDSGNLYNTDIDFNKTIKDLYIKYDLENIINKNKSILGDKFPSYYLDYLDFLKYDLKIKLNDRKEKDSLIKMLFSTKEVVLEFIIDILSNKKLSPLLDYNYLLNVIDSIKNRSHLINYIDISKYDSFEEIVSNELIKNEKDILGKEIGLYINDDDIILMILEMGESKYKIIRKIFSNIDNNIQRENFILSISSNISEEKLKNILLIVSFLHINKIFLDLDEIFSINISEEKLLFLEENFTLFNISKILEHLDDFINDFSKYINSNNGSILEKYIKRDISENLIISSEIDIEINNIIESNKEENIILMSKKVDNLIKSILLDFSSAKLSSTKIYTNGKGSGSYVRRLDNFIQTLLKKTNESNLEYLKRIQNINWYLVYNAGINDIRNSRLKNILNVIENKNFGFYDSLKEFSNIIDRIGVSDNEDLSDIKEKYLYLLEKYISKIK